MMCPHIEIVTNIDIGTCQIINLLSMCYLMQCLYKLLRPHSGNLPCVEANPLETPRCVTYVL